MKKAILIGNGVTSQLISDYMDCKMIEKIKKELGGIYFELDDLLVPYRKLEIKDEFHVSKLLIKSNIEPHHFQRYFIEQSLLDEIDKPHITALETLLKVAHLFHHIKEFDYDKIKSHANKIYYNNGKNGILNINKENFNIDKFSNFINSFQYVFTTNFDNILDDVYDGDVYHLHGGFRYIQEVHSNGAIYIKKVKDSINVEKAHLIWGRNAEEKLSQTTGGCNLSMVNDSLEFGSSVIENYYNCLKYGLYDELHIWGYSGLNDQHINMLISTNDNLKNIYCYVSPNDVMSNDVYRKMNHLYNFEKKHKLIIKSWDEIWKIFEY